MDIKYGYIKVLANLKFAKLVNMQDEIVEYSMNCTVAGGLSLELWQWISNPPNNLLKCCLYSGRLHIYTIVHWLHHGNELFGSGYYITISNLSYYINTSSSVVYYNFTQGGLLHTEHQLEFHKKYMLVVFQSENRHLHWNHCCGNCNQLYAHYLVLLCVCKCLESAPQQNVCLCAESTHPLL